VSEEQCTRKYESRKKLVIHPLMSEQHNNVIDIIIQKSYLTNELKYYT